MHSTEILIFQLNNKSLQEEVMTAMAAAIKRKQLQNVWGK